jgi:hypothetical protein
MPRTATSGSKFAYSWQQILVQVRFSWPRKTAERLSHITGSGVRTCYRWLAGGAEPGAPEVLAILSALRDEHAARGRMLQQFELNLE